MPGRPLPNFTQPLPVLGESHRPPSPPSPTLLPPSNGFKSSAMEGHTIQESDLLEVSQILEEKMDDSGEMWLRIGPRRSAALGGGQAGGAAKRQKCGTADIPVPRGLTGPALDAYDRPHVGRHGTQEPNDHPSTSTAPQYDGGPAVPVVRTVVILQPADKDKGFQTICPFKLKREVIKLCNATHARFLRFGGLAVTVEAESDAKTLMQTDNILNVKVKATAPRSQRFCRGVITNVVPGVTCDAIKDELQIENKAMKIIGVTRLGKPTSNTYCIEFEGKVLPSHLYIGYWRHKTSLL